MNFTLVVTKSNIPYIWIKNVYLNLTYSKSDVKIQTKPVIDLTYPR